MNLKKLVMLPLLFGPGYAQSPDYRQVVEQVLPAVVTISGQSEDGEIVGSGFLVDSSGRIVTSLHVLKSLKTIKVKLANGEIYDSAKVRAYDERRDLAVIQVPGFALPTCRLGNSNDLKQGEPVLLVGAGSGLQGSVTSGIVSAIRDLPEGFKVIQTDAAANPGNSGGPLFNTRAEAIGVLGFKLKGSEGQNFAVPINYARGLLENATADLDLAALRSKSAEPLARQDAPRGVEDVGAVKSVYVGNFGVSEAAFLVREKLINRLSQQSGLQVASSIQDADSLLTGFVGADAYGRADATVFRLIGKAGKILWSGEYSSGGWGSASSGIAKKVVDDLVKAVRKKK